MELSHEIAGLLISAAGAVLMLTAGLVPRQVRRLHVHALESLESVEPFMLSWLVRAIGLAVLMLGVVTAAGT